MEATLWSKVHGAAVHFPLALALGSGACDAAALLLRDRPVARDLRVTAGWSLVIAAAGSVPAVVSGLVLTRGGLLGHGALRMHHLFVWPAFALLMLLGTWRLLTGPASEHRSPLVYLAAVAGLGGLMAAAGYWGGEMILAR